MLGLLTRPTDRMASTAHTPSGAADAVQYGENQRKPLPGSRSHSTLSARPSLPPSFARSMRVTQPTAPLSG